MGTMESAVTRTELRLKGEEEYIKLGQLLKVCGAVSSGVEAKIFILDGKVSVNGETETRRGRKLFAGDTVDFEDYHIKVIQ